MENYSKIIQLAYKNYDRKFDFPNIIIHDY